MKEAFCTKCKRHTQLLARAKCYLPIRKYVLCFGWLQYLETLDEMESIGNTAAQQTALSGSTGIDEPDVTSNGTMVNNVQYVEAGKPATPTSSSQASAASGAKSNGSASKVQPLGYRSASQHCADSFMRGIGS